MPKLQMKKRLRQKQTLKQRFFLRKKQVVVLSMIMLLGGFGLSFYLQMGSPVAVRAGTGEPICK